MPMLDLPHVILAMVVYQRVALVLNEQFCASIGPRGLATLAVGEAIRRGKLPPASAPRGRAPLVNGVLKGDMRVTVWKPKECVIIA
jgi:hypothetical protein